MAPSIADLGLRTADWKKVLGGMCGQRVQQTSDGGYIVAGICPAETVCESVFLLKTSSIGDGQWKKIYNVNNVGTEPIFF